MATLVTSASLVELKCNLCNLGGLDLVQKHAVQSFATDFGMNADARNKVVSENWCCRAG